MHQELEAPGIAVTLEELAAFAAAVGEGERAAAQLRAATPSVTGSGAGRRGGRRQACATESVARELVGLERYPGGVSRGSRHGAHAAVEAALAGCRRIAAATGEARP